MGRVTFRLFARLVTATIIAVAFVALPLHASAQATCIDPATPLQTLVKSYDRWPALAPGRLPLEARTQLEKYLASRSRSDYKKALLAYENLERDFPRDAGTKLALGLLYVMGPDMNFETSDGYRHVAVFNYSNADTRAARHLQNVVHADSTQWIAAVAMTRVALVSIEEGRVREARALVERALTADPGSVPLNLAWYDLLIKTEQHAEARAFIERQGNGCAALQHARAEAMMLTGDTAAGSRLYINTLARAQPQDIHRFYDDARVMMTVAYRNAYYAVPPAERPKWLLAYWNRTAAASGRTLETRVAEQTVRAAYADAQFRAVHFVGERAFDRLAVISDTSHIVPWDAAGVYYVRHGPPDDRYNVDLGATEYEGWTYRSMEPPVVVLMSRTKAPRGDWKPLDVPPCTDTGFLGQFDVARARERIRTGVGMEMRDMYFALAEVNPLFTDLVRECQFVAMGAERIRYEQLKVQFRHDNYTILRELAQTESSLPHFLKPVRIAAATYEFRTAALEPEVVALSWIPVADLRDGTSAPARLRLTYSVTDSLTGFFRTDTMVALPPNASTGLVRVPVVWRSPSIANGTLRVTVTDPADTLRGATTTVAFHVRGGRAPVAVSDIVLADTGVDGPLTRGATRLSPLPDHEVQTGDAFRIFFEMYGLKDGEEVETSIEIRRRTDRSSMREQLRIAGRREERTIGFTEAAKLDARGIAVRDVDIAGDLISGTYDIDVTIKTAAGVTARRTGVLRVQ